MLLVVAGKPSLGLLLGGASHGTDVGGRGLSGAGEVNGGCG